MRRGVLASLVVWALVLAGCAQCPFHRKATGGGGSPQAGAPALPEQTVCPVMGGPIDPAVHVDYQGRPVHFCCPACIARFQNDPGKYLSRLAPAPAARERSADPS